jgi:prephenate dehydrogenase
MNQICMIGCGLIGGSFAALVKQYSPNTTIVGMDTNDYSLATAKTKGFIDSWADYMDPNTLASVDLIIIASPMSTVIPIIESLTSTVSKSKKIIEFSSVKSFLKTPIITNSHHTIMAMHPMGGRDTQGVDHAAPAVLEGCPMIIFEPMNTTHEWIESCSFQLIHCPSTDIHDEWMMHVSHGPYILACVLPHILSKKNDHELSQLKSISAGGFRDTTRVSNSAIEWGMGVLNENKPNAIALINQAMSSLQMLKMHLEENNQNQLHDWLIAAKTTRNKVA